MTTRKLKFIFGILIFFLSIPYLCSAASERRVLILNSYHIGYYWSDSITQSAIDLLHERFDSIEIYVEYMDTKRLYSKESIELFKKVLLLKYENIKIDAIISSDDNALTFLLENKDDLFPKVPVIFCGVNNYEKAEELKDNPEYTGLLEALEIKPTVDVALKLCPDTKKIMFISDCTPTGKTARKVMREIEKYYSNTQVVYLNGEDLTTEELISVLENAQPGTIAVCFVWFRDKTGRYFSLEHIGTRIMQNSTVPMFALSSFWMKYGAIGGKLNAGSTHGAEAADIASKIIKGINKPKDFPIEKCRGNSYVFDWVQLHRWNFDLSLLPEGSKIVNREFSFFQEYKTLVISVLTFIVFQTLVIIGFISSLVRRKRAERERMFTEKRYQNLLESITDWVWEVDSDLKYTFSSSNVEQIIGYTTEEVIGKTPLDFMEPEEKERIAVHVENVVNKGQSIDMLENTLIHKDGHKVILETSGAPVLDHKNNFMGFRGIDRDVTDKKNIEKEREELFKDLTVKNEELESIVYIASHDLRSPLVNIQGFSNEASEIIDILLKKIDEMDIAREEKEEIKKVSASTITMSFDYIKKNISKMDQLLVSLLKLARLGSSALEIKVINMDGLIESILASMYYQIKNSGIKIETEPLPDCIGDYTQINQVFSNLIDNAVKYVNSEKKAKIKISAAAKYDDSKVVYCIEDNGIGIDPLYHKKIFDIFQRLNPNDDLEGMGIGLTIVKRIVIRNNGNIWIDSEPGHGCKVFVEFPLAVN